LNGRNAPRKNSGAHRKNFNEVRLISLLGKCRPLLLFAINIKCTQICVGVPLEKVYLPPRPVSIYPDCTFSFCYLFCGLQTDSTLHAAGASCKEAPPKAKGHKNF